MLSMTGFGIKKSKLSHGQLVTQVKSVNSRFLDIKINIPREFNFLENDIRQLLKKSISRGNVEVYCSHKKDNQTKKAQVKTDVALAKLWLTSYRKLQKDLKLDSANPSLQEIIQSAPVMSLYEDKNPTPAEKKAFLKNIEDSIKLCVKERKREGQSLMKVLKGLLESLLKETKTIEKNREQANKDLTKKWKTKLEKLKNETSLEPARLALEASLLIEKSDINEELVRLNEHIAACKKLLRAEGRVGKKLDFYSQELLREVNTIGSKSQVVALTNSVVQAKSLIEQIREQVQNVE